MCLFVCLLALFTTGLCDLICNKTVMNNSNICTWKKFFFFFFCVHILNYRNMILHLGARGHRLSWYTIIYCYSVVLVLYVERKYACTMNFANAQWDTYLATGQLQKCPLIMEVLFLLAEGFRSNSHYQYLRAIHFTFSLRSTLIWTKSH